jgi:hypothetical protein
VVEPGAGGVVVVLVLGLVVVVVVVVLVVVVVVVGLVVVVVVEDLDGLLLVEWLVECLLLEAAVVDGGPEVTGAEVDGSLDVSLGSPVRPRSPNPPDTQVTSRTTITTVASAASASIGPTERPPRRSSPSIGIPPGAVRCPNGSDPPYPTPYPPGPP